MENSSFNTVVVRDSRIQDISTKVDYTVYKGAASSNYVKFPVQQDSTSSLNFSAKVPNQNTIFDREVLLSAKPTILIEIPAGVAVGTKCFAYGNTEALNQFPLNSLILTLTSQINGATVSVNTQDIMHPLLRATDEKALSKYNCPNMPDKKFKKYSDMVLSQSSPLASFESSKGDLIPRGAHPVEYVVRRYVNGGNPVNTANQNSSDADLNAALTSTSATTNTWEIELTFECAEPLLFASPFLFGENVNNRAGLYGVDGIELTINLDSSCKKVLSSSTGVVMNLSLKSLKNATLHMNTLQCQASDMLASKNVVPYTVYSRVTYKPAEIVAGATEKVTVNAMNLTQIPNRIFIAARKPMNSQTCKDSNTFWSIKDFNATFNNRPGILSGANAHALYKMSVANGSKQDWYEFAGVASKPDGRRYATAGGVLIINVARDITLPEELSNGSIGSNFDFQYDISITNTEGVNMAPEIVTIFEYSGLFVTQAGISTPQLGLLTNNLVLESTTSQFGESDNYIKQYGSENSANYSASGLKNIPLLNKKKGGVSGGAKSGGAVSGGAWA